MKAFKNHKRTLLFLVVLFSFSDLLWSQQNAQFTEYMYNTMRINPAYAGARGHLSVLAMYRNQWIGMTGAPTTISVSAHLPVGRYKRVGVGAEFVSDEIGPSAQHTLATNFSYLLALSNKVFLSLGLKAGIYSFSIAPEKLNIYDHSGVNLQELNIISPVFGVGFYFYGDRWYVGISSPNILTTKTYKVSEISTINRKAHFYLLAGYSFALSEAVELKPIVLLRAVSGAPLAESLSLNAIVNKKFTVGAAYQWNSSISLLAAIQLSRTILVGYAYDYSTTPITHYNNGSHEIFLRFELL